MISVIPSKSKSKRSSSTLKEHKQQKSDNKFLKSYSQLLNQHFTHSIKQKSSLRRISSSQGFRTKKSQKSNRFNEDNDEVKSHNQFSAPKQFLVNPYNLLSTNLSLSKSIFGGSQDKEILTLRSTQSRKRHEVNPQNQKIQHLILTKTQLVEKNSHQNVLLNQKLLRNTHQKKTLMNQIESLRLEILKQKKIKSKISTDMGKLMNKLESTQEAIRKTQQERYFVKQETGLTQKQCSVERRKILQLERASQVNKEQIKTENEMIQMLNKNLQKTKMEFFQTKNQLNSTKDLYMRESKCLVKMEMNFNQVSEERDHMCKVISRSVANTKTSIKQDH